MKPPLFVALDLDDRSQVLQLAKGIKDFVGGYKVGPRLIYKYGASLIEELSQLGPVFVDNKYYDIPHVMDAAVRATFKAGASYTTVHLAAGVEALSGLAKTEKELNLQRPFKILGVSVLTSFSESTKPVHWKDQSIDKHVFEMMAMGKSAGLSGFVCSAQEVNALRQKFTNDFFVTPGIRFKDEAKHDQSRVIEPKEAIDLGSSALVVGRPIVAAKDPVVAAKKYFDTLK